jgi:Fe-S-cluster containining protein
MADLAEEEQKLAEYCKRCQGKCCRGHYVLLSRKEYARLKEIKDFSEGRIDSPTGCAVRSIDALSCGKCPFLGEEGCVLSGKDRPLVCRMFPVTYTLEKEGLAFHLSRFCPFAEAVLGLKNWLAETKKQASKELKRDWSGREVRCFGRYLRKSAEALMDI